MQQLMRYLNYSAPVNWAAPINRGLVGWWQVLPLRLGGRRWMDLLEDAPALMTNMGPSTAVQGWAATTRPGGWGEVRLNGGVNAGYLNAGSGVRTDALGLGPLTYALWINPRAIVDGMALITREGGTGSGYLNFLVLTGGILLLSRHFSGSPQELDRLSASSVVTVGTWQHVAVTWDGTGTGTGIRFYRNGVETGYGFTQDAGGAPTTDATFDLTFGGSVDAVSWTGALDDIRIYNRVLPPNAIASLARVSRLGYAEELTWAGMPLTDAFGYQPRSLPVPHRPLRFWRRAA